jgi:hypothetical protein
MSVRKSTPRELGYAEASTTQTGLGTTTADVTGLSITFTVGARAVWVEAVIPLIQQVTSTGQPEFYITDDANDDLGRSVPATLAASAAATPPPIKVRIAAGAGTVTRKVRGKTSAGTVSVLADGTAPGVYKPFIRAYEV